MELVRTVLLNVIVLLFFATILDFLLPNGSFRSYMKMAMGLFSVLTLLHPVMQALQLEQWDGLQQKGIQAGQMVLREATEESAESQAVTIMEQYNEAIAEQYAEQTAKQVESLLLLTDYSVSSVVCNYMLTTEGETQQMQIQVLLDGSDTEETQELEAAISGYFGLMPEQVQIQWTNE